MGISYDQLVRTPPFSRLSLAVWTVFVVLAGLYFLRLPDSRAFTRVAGLVWTLYTLEERSRSWLNSVSASSPAAYGRNYFIALVLVGFGSLVGRLENVLITLLMLQVIVRHRTSAVALCVFFRSGSAAHARMGGWGSSAGRRTTAPTQHAPRYVGWLVALGPSRRANERADAGQTDG